MKLTTRHFGEIEIDENEIITFKDGILGFENLRRYITILNPDSEIPFNWLQSIDEPSLAFVITTPFIFIDEYEFDIHDNTIKQLEIESYKDVIIYSIVVVPENVEDMTINLKAPIIVNEKSRLAKQIILENDKYELKYKIFDKIEKNG